MAAIVVSAIAGYTDSIVIVSVFPPLHVSLTPSCQASSITVGDMLANPVVPESTRIWEIAAAEMRAADVTDPLVADHPVVASASSSTRSAYRSIAVVGATVGGTIPHGNCTPSSLYL